jgi:hypothetical protein
MRGIMNEDILAPFELKQKQLDERLNNLEKSLKPKKDIWDVISATTPLISGILISGIGLYFAYNNNEAQLKLQETQTIERFFPHLNGTEQEKKAAILAISSLTNTETAAKYAELFPSEGTASALKTIASSGSARAHDKDVANKALVSTFHRMADDYQANQNTTQAAQAYQQSIDAQSQLVGADSPELISDLLQLVDAYKADKKYNLAESTLRHILKIQKNSSGTKSPEFIDTLNKLAALFKLEGKTDSADHISEYANLLAQQKPEDTAPPATSSISAVNDVLGTDTSKSQAVTSTLSDTSAVVADTTNAPPPEPAEVLEKSVNNKADNAKTESKSEAAKSESAKVKSKGEITPASDSSSSANRKSSASTASNTNM